MDQQPSAASLWDAVRGWADSAGLLLPPEGDAQPGRPRVPQSVCDSCPICQAAATFDQVNPDVLAELTEVARSLVNGVGSALSAAADQRLGGGAGGHVVPGEAAATGESDDPSI